MFSLFHLGVPFLSQHPGSDCMIVTIDHFQLNIPISKAVNYGSVKNGKCSPRQSSDANQVLKSFGG